MGRAITSEGGAAPLPIPPPGRVARAKPALEQNMRIAYVSGCLLPPASICSHLATSRANICFGASAGVAQPGCPRDEG